MRSLLALLLLACAVPAQAGDLRVGAAAVVITPPLGTPMAGYYSPRGAEGVHDDLYARALVLDKDGTRVALVALDLVSTTPALVKEARLQIERVTAVPGEDVMISATHTHTGPVLLGRTQRDEAGAGLDLARRYGEELPGRIAEAVRQAEAALTPALVAAGSGHEATIAFNRRFHMKDGTVSWNPSLLNPNVLKPAGPIDPEVPVVSFVSAKKQPLAMYVNYAVHLDTIGGREFSADLPYYLRKALAEVKGPGMVTVYTTGCCGDVNHRNVQWGERQQGFEQAARMGVVLAGEVLRTIPQLRPIEPGVLRCQRVIVPLPLPKLEPGDVEKAKALAARHRDRTGKPPPFLETVWAYKVLDVAAREGKPNEAEVQVITLGNDLAWVSLPGEIFAELGLALKQDSPFRHTIIAELANGSVGYVPARRAYAQGNYEVVSARCAEGSGELLVQAALRLLREAYTARGGSTKGHEETRK
jgi:hypothetical protein